jgi:hypothetical protein
MRANSAETIRVVSQAIAIVCLIFLLGMIAHKGHADISLLAEQHSGQQFWVEVGRYLINNLAGGGSAPAALKDR